MREITRKSDEAAGGQASTSRFSERESGRSLMNTRGFINGNSVSFRKGLVNGTGLVNGSGLVNGVRAQQRKGLTNGNGLINGNGFTNGLSLRKNRRGVIMQKDLRIGLSLLIGFILVVPPISLLLTSVIPPGPAAEGIAIDGRFDDWASVPKYVDSSSAPDNIRLVGYATDLTKSKLSFYIKVQGNLFPYEEPDVFEIFLDIDGDGSTGYSLTEGFGSEFRVEVYGWDGAVQNSALYRFQGLDRLNFSSWITAGGVGVAPYLNELEVQVDTDLLDVLESDYKVLIKAKDHLGAETESSVTPSGTFGALLVEQIPTLQSSVITGSNVKDVAQLLFSARGSEVNVSSVAISASAGSVGPISAFSVPAGSTVTKNVTVDITGLPAETLVRVSLTGVSADRPVRLKVREARCYALAVPSGIRVDGIFEDWNNLFKTLSPGTDSPDVANDNIDITHYSTNRSSTSAFFFMNVMGEALAGTSMPKTISRPPETPGGGGGGGGGPPPVTILPRVSGEDVARMYIDSNTYDLTGVAKGTILADHMLEIRGLNGRVTSKAFYKYSLGTWNVDSSATLLAEAEVKDSRLESSVPIVSLDALNAPEVVFETTDWSLMGDSTAMHGGLKSIEVGTKAPFLLVTEGTKFTGDADNQFIVTAVQDGTAAIQIDSSSKKVSMRFTAQSSLTVSSIRFHLGSATGSPNIRSGLQGDSSGDPSGTWLGATSNGYADSTTLAGGWNTLALGETVSTTASTVYHMVLQYAGSGTAPDGSNNVVVRATTPNNLRYPKTGASDGNTDVKTYDGASWTSQGFQPVYILETSAPEYEGNPYHTFSERQIYGTGNAWGDRFNIGSDRTFSQAKFYLKKVGAGPWGDITMVLRDIDSGTNLATSTLTSASIGAAYAWVTFDFNPASLVSAANYRLYLQSEGSTGTDYYATPGAVANGASPYDALTFDGTTTKETQITNTGSPEAGPVDNQGNDIPLQLIPEFSDVLMPALSVILISFAVVRSRRRPRAQT